MKEPIQEDLIVIILLPLVLIIIFGFLFLGLVIRGDTVFRGVPASLTLIALHELIFFLVALIGPIIIFITTLVILIIEMFISKCVYFATHSFRSMLVHFVHPVVLQRWITFDTVKEVIVFEESAHDTRLNQPH